MKAWKQTCNDCGHVYCWVGLPPEDKICGRCKSENTVAEHDMSTEAARKVNADPYMENFLRDHLM